MKSNYEVYNVDIYDAGLQNHFQFEKQNPGYDRSTGYVCLSYGDVNINHQSTN